MLPSCLSRYDRGRNSLASQEAVAAWDSVAAITMMNVIEDEFGLEMDLDDLGELDSFEKVHAYLQKRLQVV